MSETEAIIYIVEDDDSFRRSVERLLGSSGLRVVSFSSATEFIEHEPVCRPACLLLDVRLPDLDGMRLQVLLAEKGMDLPIIFMTGHGSISMGVEAMKKGAVDFLPKPFEKEALFRAIDEALERDARSMAERSSREAARGLIGKLTAREVEVMRWVITGKPNKQIADKLGIAEKTVKVHRCRVMHKTQLSSVAELIRLAEVAGLSAAE